MAQSVKNLPANAGEMPEMWGQPLGWEERLEEEMATDSSILSCEIPWTEESGRLQSMGVTKMLNTT